MASQEPNRYVRPNLTPDHRERLVQLITAELNNWDVHSSEFEELYEIMLKLKKAAIYEVPKKS